MVFQLILDRQTLTVDPDRATYMFSVGHRLRRCANIQPILDDWLGSDFDDKTLCWYINVTVIRFHSSIPSFLM